MSYKLIKGLSCLSVLMIIVSVQHAQAQDLNQLPEKVEVWNLKDSGRTLEDISFFIAVNTDSRLRFDRSDDAYLKPLIRHLDMNVFANQQKAVLFPRVLAGFIINSLVKGESLREIGPKLIDIQKEAEIQSLKDESADLSLLIGKKKQAQAVTLDEHYDHLLVVLEGLMAMGSEVTIGTKQVSWEQTFIPKIIARIKEKKAQEVQDKEKSPAPQSELTSRQ